MPMFKVGDRVRIPEEAQGPDVEWLGQVGVVKDIMGMSTSGTVTLPNRPKIGEGGWEQDYLVDFPGLKTAHIVSESWLEPA